MLSIKALINRPVRLRILLCIKKVAGAVLLLDRLSYTGNSCVFFLNEEKLSFVDFKEIYLPE